MRFLIDAQLPPALAGLLESHGHQAAHVQDAGLRDAADPDIWSYALREQTVIVTKDEDFAHRFRQAARGPAIVWLRVGNTSRRALLQWFEPLIPQVTSLLQQGEKLVEVR
jgi:predicted nuclease of predicted toxin-antitoxin system